MSAHLEQFGIWYLLGAWALYVGVWTLRDLSNHNRKG